MPTTTIPIIARTNTIDEWRIQTNKSASDLNDLGFGTYDKDRGTLLLSNTSILSITAEGTPLQVANNVLFQNNLTLSNNLFLGVESSGTGNLIVGNTLTVEGRGKAFSVSNNSYVGVDLEVVRSIYTSNVYANTDMTIGNDVTIGGTVDITSSGTVLSIPDGEASINLITAETTVSENVRTDNLYAAFARIDVLDDLAFARIGILENTTGNSYYLSSNSHNSNTITTRYITANISGNIVNFSSNVASINTATILDANIVTQISESATINVSSTNTATILDGNVVTLISEDTTINVASINVSSTNDATVLVGNVVTLTSNDSTLNVATVNTANITWLTSSNTIYANNIITTNVEVSTINAAYVNVSSDLWLQEGAQLRIYADDVETEVFTVDGKSTLQTTYIRGNIAVEGTWTALGNVEYEVSEFTLNARTPTNADATIRNNRVVGDDAFIKWDETDDQWKVSKGDTYDDLFGILDASFLNATVTSNSTANVATPSAVKAAFETAQFAGGYANNAYVHANNSYIHANNSYLHANASHTMANAAFDRSNNVYSHANSSYIHANAAYVQANTTNAHVYGSITTRIDTLEANTALDAKFREEIVLNSEQNQASGPPTSMSSAIIVDRGTQPNVEIKWVERQTIVERFDTGNEDAQGNPIYDTRTNSVAGPNWIFTKDGTNYQNVAAQAAELYANASYTQANAAFILAESVNQDVNEPNTGTKKRITDVENTLSSLTGGSAGAVGKATNLAGGEAYRIPYQTAIDTTDFIAAPTVSGTVLAYLNGNWAWTSVSTALGGTINGNLELSGTLKTRELDYNNGLEIDGSRIVLNNDILAGQGPKTQVSNWGRIEVYRGTTVPGPAVIRYNESEDQWEYTNDGVNYKKFDQSGSATTFAGGIARQILVQTAPGVTGFIDPPSGTVSKFLAYSSGAGFTWEEINISGTVSLPALRIDATQIVSGQIPTARLSGGTYGININGNASTATTAGSATSATNATTATSARNVISGGNVSTASGSFASSVNIQGSLTVQGNATFRSSVNASGQTITANRFEGTATAALYQDLAEKYLPDDTYTIGTILSIGGEKEVTASTRDLINSIIGSVSEAPAITMNSEQKGGVAVALKGRVPIRVIGECKKGDLLTISDIPGVAVRTDKNELPIRFICLENKNDKEEGLVFAAVI
jgi:hypothetical protein